MPRPLAVRYWPSWVEVETGKRTDRPKLVEALAACRATRATLPALAVGWLGTFLL